MKIRYYVDALNFYYHISRPYNSKWIDLEGTLSSVVQERELRAQTEKIIIFTAEVVGKRSAERQRIYLNALKTHNGSKIEIVWGHFTSVVKSGLDKTGTKVKVTMREEKCTDVNIACRMVDDSHTMAGKKFDVACLVSNDADLSSALEIKKRLQQRTILICPRKPDIKTPAMSEILKKHIPQEDRIHYIEEFHIKTLPAIVGSWRCPKSLGWKV